MSSSTLSKDTIGSRFKAVDRIDSVKSSSVIGNSTKQTIIKNIIVGENSTYKIDTKRIIGKGAFSTVYVGTDINAKNRVAIKKICRNKLNRYYLSVVDNEIKIVNIMINNEQYQHSNIIKYFDIIYVNDLIYIVMEYCSDGTFASLLVKPIKEYYAKYYFKQLIGGLKALHDMNIIHRDIKPENLLLTNDYKTIKICDFGFSHFANDESYILRKIMYGSPIYMAPETFFSESNNKIYKNTDVWSAGIILYEILYGHHPYKGSKDVNDVRTKHIKIDDMSISDDAVHLLRNMLNDNLNRISTEEIINTQWMITSCKLEDVKKIVLSELFNIVKHNGSINVYSQSQSLPLPFEKSEFFSKDFVISPKVTNPRLHNSINDKYQMKIQSKDDLMSHITKTIINDGSFDLLIKKHNLSSSSDSIPDIFDDSKDLQSDIFIMELV